MGKKLTLLNVWCHSLLSGIGLCPLEARAMPKKDGSYCLIVDLSSPPGRSIKDCISNDDYSVVFSRYDDTVSLVQPQGKGVFMAKADIKHAFRIFPVRPRDYKLLGTFWEGLYFVELRLPFGLRSLILNTYWSSSHLISYLLVSCRKIFLPSNSLAKRICDNVKTQHFMVLFLCT